MEFQLSASQGREMMLPKDWKSMEIGAVASINRRTLSSETKPDLRFRYLEISSVSKGRINYPEQAITFKEAPSRARRIVQNGDVLMSMVRPNLQGFAHFRSGREDIIASTGFAIITADGADPGFIYQSLYSPKVVAHLSGLLVGSGYPAINSSDVEKLVIAIPSDISEQRKIASILATWDEASEKLDALIAVKDRRIQALMQQLLTGKKRVKGFAGKWRNQELGSAIKPISRPVPKPDKPYLAAGIRSHGKGVFLKQDFKPSEIALDELFQLRTDDLVVNITFAWEGALAIVPPEANGALVSHRFPAFRCEDNKAAIGFIRHLIRTKRFVFLCGLSSPGGAGRNRVLSKTSFLKIAVSLPTYQEQTEIAAILDACDEELSILHAQRAAFDQQKRGLMQRLLTGKVRVHPDEESRNA